MQSPETFSIKQLLILRLPKTEYDRAAINSACTQALNLASQGQTIGRDAYPHAYNGTYLPILSQLRSAY
jgi:hypothetical protein